MWIDYAIYVSTGLALVAAVGLVVILIRNRAGVGIQLVLVAMLLIGVLATPFLRPERFREAGEDLDVIEGAGGLQTEVEMIGRCLSVFRQLGPLSFIAGNDLFPGDGWDLGPYNGCDASDHVGTIFLPDSVRSGEWMLCDYHTCHQLVREI